MSDTIWVQVRGRPDAEPQDCSIMLKRSGRLDRLARQLGVAQPSGFHDHSSLAEEYADEFDIPPELCQKSGPT